MKEKYKMNNISKNNDIEFKQSDEYSTINDNKNIVVDKIKIPYKVAYKNDNCRIVNIFGGNECTVFVGKTVKKN